MSTSRPGHQWFRLVLTVALTFSLAAGAWPRPQRAAGPRVSGTADARADVAPKTPASADAEMEQRARAAYGKLGVSFEENRGQTDKRVRFLARRGGTTVFLTNDEASFVLSAPTESLDSHSDERWAEEEPTPAAPAGRGRGTAKHVRPKFHAVWMKYEGANPWAEVVGERELKGRVNYFRGDDPSKWQTDVRTYGAVRYRGIYEGIDLVYYGNEQGEMEYDFEVAPGADPRQISLLMEGADAMEVDAAGDLVLSTPAGPMRQRRPAVYQEAGGARREVESGYAVEAGGRVRFALGEYDATAPLIIDPVLEYSTYLGGGNGEGATGIAVDASRNAYVTGYTYSADFPTKNPVQSTNPAPAFADAFVTKFNATGSAIVYSTYLGGSNKDDAYNIAVDAAGNAYVAGATYSTNFPTANAIQSGHASGGSDAFVAKLNAAGNALVYSTYLGGGSGEEAQDIAVDSQGSALVTGDTGSSNYPMVNPVQATYGGSVDAFVTKLNPAGSALIYSTYLGGSNFDLGYSIAVDAAGNAYVAGYADSTNFPTANAIQSGHASGGSDAFVTKLNAAGSAFVYSTYLGGSSVDQGLGIAVDSTGNAYVTGSTDSSNFPTVNPKQPAKGISTDAFVTKLNAAGSALIYSTYLGGNNTDSGRGIAVDSSGNAYVVGITHSTNFPVAFPIKGTNSGDRDVFVTKYNAAGSAFLFSTYLGGNDTDDGNDIATDAQGSAYVAGETESTNYPVAEAFQGADALGADAFVTKISLLPSIRGRVLNGAGVGVPGVTVKLTGSLAKNDVTDAAGNYSFYGLTPSGDFVVTPVKTNVSFVPASRTFTNLNSNLVNINFSVPTLSVNNVTVTEGNAGTLAAVFTVTLKPAATQTVTVKYQTANGTTNPATSVTDYTPLPLSPLSFSPGQTSRTVAVTIKGDTFDELDETFKLLLSGPTNAIISDNEALGTITDNDPPPTVSVNSPVVTEGNAAVTANFTVSLSAQSGKTVKVKYATANGTATAPADYTAKALTTLIFAPGEISKTVPVTVAGDLLDEPAENFKLNLSAPSNATIATTTGTCTINDNDPPPSITIDNKTVTEPDSGTRAAVFIVRLSAASSQTVTVKYATANGTTNPATAGTDYTAIALTTLTFTPGQTSKTLTVQVRGDVIKEANETFFVNLSAATNATIADARGLGTITNDD